MREKSPIYAGVENALDTNADEPIDACLARAAPTPPPFFAIGSIQPRDISGTPIVNKVRGSAHVDQRPSRGPPHGRPSIRTSSSTTATASDRFSPKEAHEFPEGGHSNADTLRYTHSGPCSSTTFVDTSGNVTSVPPPPQRTADNACSSHYFMANATEILPSCNAFEVD